MTALGRIGAEGFVLGHVYAFGSVAVGDARRRRATAYLARQRALEAAALEQKRQVRQAMAEERVRIVQELHDTSAHTFGIIAIKATAALRTLGSRPALDVSRDALRCIVRDDGRGPAPGMREGHGMIMMRERAAVFGGQLSAGTGSARGFVVALEIPLEAGRDASLDATRGAAPGVLVDAPRTGDGAS